jgi:membrane-bound ClpP family serine protease
MLWTYIILGILIIIAAAIFEYETTKQFRDKRRQLHDTIGIVEEPLTPSGTVKIKSELWQATSVSNATIPKGASVRVLSVAGLELTVEHMEGSGDETV